MIRKATTNDLTEIQTIADEAVGAGFRTASYLRDFIENPKKVILVYEKDGKVAGFVSGTVQTGPELQNYLLKTDAPTNRSLSVNKLSGYLETICVSQHFKGFGIGKALTIGINEHFKTVFGLTTVFTTVWKSKSGANAQPLFEKLGFEWISEIPDYWYEDSLAKNSSCAECGNPPCRCSMLFYKLDF